MPLRYDTSPKMKIHMDHISGTLLSIAPENCWKGNYCHVLVMEIIMTTYWNYVFVIFLTGNFRGQWSGLGVFFHWKQTLDNWTT